MASSKVGYAHATETRQPTISPSSTILLALARCGPAVVSSTALWPVGNTLQSQ